MNAINIVYSNKTSDRMEHKKQSFWIQFAGPAVFVVAVLLGAI